MHVYGFRIVSIVCEIECGEKNKGQEAFDGEIARWVSRNLLTTVSVSRFCSGRISRHRCGIPRRLIELCRYIHISFKRKKSCVMEK